jgi:predicted nucleic acid-binding protein
VILLDTTVLVYAVGDDHPLAGTARQLMTDIRSGVVRAHTTPEVIQEFAHVRARRRTREDATALARAFADLLGPLQVVTAQNLNAGLDLWSAHPSIGSFDAVLAAVAMSVDAELVSADSGFGKINGLNWRSLASV